MKYIIDGGVKLNGSIKISGNKNSILPCMAGALLTEEEVILENVPDILDVEVFLEIFKKIGVGFKRKSGTLYINAKSIKESNLPLEMVSKLRASLLLAAPILVRKGKVNFHHPGGDIIGRRPIDVHLNGLKFLGAKVIQDDLNYKLSLGQNSGNKFFMEFSSVTGTEELILAAVIGKGSIEVRNCASEPHIVDLCRMLNLMGADIEGVGTDKLTIRRVGELSGCKFKIGDDYLEICTYAIAACITGGKIKVICDPDTDLDPMLVILAKFGVCRLREKDGFYFYGSELNSVEKVVTNIWPGFPTDLMSVVIVLATQSNGITLCHDWIYESRMFFVDKLISMGANITIADPHRVLIYGPTPLHGRVVDTPDIRAGMALVLAALVASGRSIISRVELIERGYEDVVGKLSKLGAQIKKNEN